MTESARALLTALIDYAGLFPPAELQMRAAVPRYAAHRGGAHAWMLRRFVLPLAQLEEFEHGFDDLPAEQRADAWKLAVLGGRNVEADVRKIVEFNRRHGDEGRRDARIESLDLKVHSVDDIGRAADVASEQVELFFEIPVASDPHEWLAAVSAVGGRAKVRTGGVSPEMFPSVADLARFLAACAAEHVGFKATAGLHYPVRSEHRVAHDSRSEPVLMHGFLNLFVAAAFAYSVSAGHDLLEGVLDERSPAAFTFDDGGVSVRGRRLTNDQVQSARSRFALSYGSCSIEEPTEALAAMNLI